MDRPDPASLGGPGGHHIALGRALAVIVVTVVLGALIVHSWGSHSIAIAHGSTVPSARSTTTSRPPATTTSTTTPHGQVQVLVANDSTTNNVASEYDTVLQRGGWSVLAPVTAKPPVQKTSVVYYATNKRADADVIAAAFGLPLSAVIPVSPATPVSSVAGADVVLVIGADLAAKTPPSTVASTTTTTPARTTTTR